VRYCKPQILNKHPAATYFVACDVCGCTYTWLLRKQDVKFRVSVYGWYRTHL